MDQVFARCKDSVAQGRRLENLSWRLWTRETFCVEATHTAPASEHSSLPRDIEPSRRPSADDMPQLSGSVESVADEEAVDFSAESAPMEILRPRIRRQDSCASSRSRVKEQPITSDALEKMVVSIVHEKEPLASLPEIAVPYVMPVPEADKTEEMPVPKLERSGSTTTESSTPKTSEASLDSDRASSADMCVTRGHLVVRGFSPSPAVLPRTLTPPKPCTTVSIPHPKSSPAAKLVQPKRQPRFALGGSSCEDSLSDHGRSPERRNQAALPKRRMFQMGGSSEEESNSLLKSALRANDRPGSFLNAQKKQTSFHSQPVTRTIPAAPVVEDDQSETEADYVDESAIDDDDDSSDWEDSVEDSGRSSMDEKSLFQRVDSSAQLPTRRSLITLMLERTNSERALGSAGPQPAAAVAAASAAASRARGPQRPPPTVASPNDSDEAPLMMRRNTRAPSLRPINEVPRSAAQPIMTVGNTIHSQAALSPRTTRRNMLSTELTESLRRHLLWERSQKTSTANAVMKRRHTSHDVANLRQYPERVHMTRDNDVNASSWDQYLSRDAFNNGYHSKGW